MPQTIPSAEADKNIIKLKELKGALTYSQPINMTQIEKIFSELVFGETFPKPTLVRLLKVK